MKRVLLLNSDWQPLHFITYVRAIRLLYKGKADVVSEWDECISSSSITMKLPAIIRMHDYVAKRWRTPKFKRRALFNRDKWQCQYCGAGLSSATITIDHVKPKSLGGEISWANCVSACGACNKRKANKTPEQANMKLLCNPRVPAPYHFWNITVGKDDWHHTWETFFGV